MYTYWWFLGEKVDEVRKLLISILGWSQFGTAIVVVVVLDLISLWQFVQISEIMLLQFIHRNLHVDVQLTATERMGKWGDIRKTSRSSWILHLTDTFIQFSSHSTRSNHSEYRRKTSGRFCLNHFVENIQGV